MNLETHGTFLVKLVMAYVQGELARWEFDLDYSGYVITHFPGFQAETPSLAARFSSTVDRAYEAYAWMDHDAFAQALSVALDEFFGSPNLPDII